MTLSIIDQNSQSVRAIIPAQASTDGQLIDLWLHGRSRHTQRAYRSDIERFLRHVGAPLASATLRAIQLYADSISSSCISPATAHRLLSSVKSLFSFSHRIGYLPFDVARPFQLSAVRDTLNERILDEAEVHRMLALETHPRNSAILRLLYIAGLRVSELCSLRWRDLQPRQDGGQATVFGKRGKTRTVLITLRTWNALMMLRKSDSSEDAPVFMSRKHGFLDPSQVLRIVKTAARNAGISKQVSPHWLRHAHASHALDRNAPISLVQQTLGHSDISTTGRYLHARPHDSSSRYLPI